jgi:hypothetical protein
LAAVVRRHQLAVMAAQAAIQRLHQALKQYQQLRAAVAAAG